MERATGFLVLRTLRASLCSMALRSSSTLDAFRTLVTAQGTAEGVAEDASMKQRAPCIAPASRGLLPDWSANAVANNSYMLQLIAGTACFPTQRVPDLAVTIIMHPYTLYTPCFRSASSKRLTRVCHSITFRHKAPPEFVKQGRRGAKGGVKIEGVPSFILANLRSA